MLRIESRFDPERTIYQTEMHPLTLERLRAYCKFFFIDIEKYFLRKDHDERFSFPGTYILDMMRPTIEKLHKEDSSFPISILHNMEFGCGTTEENPIFVDDRLIFKAQTINVQHKHKKTIMACVIEIYRENKIVFKGTFDYIERK